MTADQQTIVITIIVVGVVLLTLLLATLRSRPEKEAVTAIEIARVVESNIDHRVGAGVLGFFLVLSTIYCLIEYSFAQSAERQMVTLLLWIGNSLFWGVFLLANLISRGRTSVIYRDATPSDYEPRA